MRYLIDPEFRPRKTTGLLKPTGRHAAQLRSELSQRNRVWALAHSYAHENSLGGVPAVLYREDDRGEHGNFLPTSYRCIQRTPEWARRLTKVHTSAKRALLSRDPNRRELDSSNSSDALLMNIFCNPEALAAAPLHQLLSVDPGAKPVFGYRPRTLLRTGRQDATEIDMRLGDLLIEAKLTEYDFQSSPRRLIERYRDLEEVFNADQLETCDGRVQSYQLIRGVLAAHACPGLRFCVLCDGRRPDLIARWHRLLTEVKLYDLRCRLLVLTWQELAAALPDSMQIFLEQKFGICAAH